MFFDFYFPFSAITYLITNTSTSDKGGVGSFSLPTIFDSELIWELELERRRILLGFMMKVRLKLSVAPHLWLAIWLV